MPFLAITSLLLGVSGLQPAPSDPNIVVPESSVALPLPGNIYNHTNFLINNGPSSRAIGNFGPYFSIGPNNPEGHPGYDPNEVRTAYGDAGLGSGTIVIVDAYHYKNAVADFNTFSAAYGLAQESGDGSVLQVISQTSSTNSGWNEEEALDIEWAHAMAPSAKIVLVEAANTGTGLYTAVNTAAAITGVREISMSWSGNEGSYELSYDSTYFGQRSIVYFAATGDTGSARGYPALSPNVIGCGGTSLYINADNSYNSESAWADGGGGPSAVEPIPSYQINAGLSTKTGGFRSSPDISAVADTATAVSVYTSAQGYGWTAFGGTSVATPVLAGLHNASASVHRSSEFNWIYQNQGLFHDIISGSNGYSASTGYDFATGIGTPRTANSL